MKMRSISSTSIQYILIQKDFGEEGMIEYSYNPSNSIFRLLSHYPRDLMQFQNQKSFFRSSMYIKEINPAFNLLIFTDKQLKLVENLIYEYSNLLKLRNRPVVYFIDAEADIKTIRRKIINSGQKIWSYTFYGRPPKRDKYFDKKHYFSSVPELIEGFENNIREIKSILSEITEGSKELVFNIDKSENNEEFKSFDPLVANYFTSMQISSEYWKLRYPTSIDAPKDIGRNKLLLESVISIDCSHKALSLEEEKIQRLPILILSFPFYDPSILEISKQNLKASKKKDFSRLLSIEQSLNYLLEIEIEDDMDKIYAESIASYIINPKLKMLDGISYLQASFTFSPTMRFPIIGKSIYKELSFFNPKNNFFSTPKSRKNRLRSIIKFGNKLSSLTITKEIKEYLKTRKGAILTISDLPIELLCLDSVPLGFTHDVCRIHELNYQGSLNNYSAHNRLEYSVTEKTVENTLVILSGRKTEHNEFKAVYELVEFNSRELKFKYEYCNTIKSVSEAVKKHNPEILIFDCHGNLALCQK